MSLGRFTEVPDTRGFITWKPRSTMALITSFISPTSMPLLVRTALITSYKKTLIVLPALNSPQNWGDSYHMKMFAGGSAAGAGLKQQSSSLISFTVDPRQIESPIPQHRQHWDLSGAGGGRGGAADLWLKTHCRSPANKPCSPGRLKIDCRVNLLPQPGNLCPDLG